MHHTFLPRARALAAVGGGLLWAAAFPRFSIAGLAWIVPGLLLLITLGPSARLAFRLGYLAGLAHFLCSLYWLLYNPFPIGAAAGWLALSAYLALFPASWVWLCHRLRPGTGSIPRRSADELAPRDGWLWREAVVSLVTSSWCARAAWAFFCAIAWVALEMLAGRLWSGYPWNLLGVSQYELTPLVQVSSLAGVYGVSFLVVWSSAALLLAGLRLTLNPGRRGLLVTEVMFPMLAVAVSIAWGGQRILSAPSWPRTLKMALVQPSIPQVLIWDHREDANRFARLVELSRVALAAKPDLLVWPEAAMPPFTEENYEALTNLVADHRVWLVLGADDYERRPGPADAEDYDAYNAAFLIDPEGQYVARYRKQHLVIFGEYVPLSRWLPFLKFLTPVESGFLEGSGPVEFPITSPGCTVSVLICFEDVFPHLARRNVTPNTDFLLNLTNNGWFGESAAQWQHAANAVFRAIENGLPLVRCTNNGLTCWIDPFGRVRQILATEDGNVYGPGFMAFELPLPQEGSPPGRTFYHRHGDWFGWSCGGLTLVALGIGSCRSRFGIPVNGRPG